MNEHDQYHYRQGTFTLTPPDSDVPAAGAAPVEAMTPAEAAKALIRPYVLRGDLLEDLTKGLMGYVGTDFAAQIGGGIGVGEGRRKIRRDQIAVSRVGAEAVSVVFPLAGLYREIRAEAAANPDVAGAGDAATVALPADTFVERIDRDPDVLPNRRLPGDFWPEFLAEWRFREEYGLPPVSPAEFADMRDRADGTFHPVGARWRLDTERPAYPEWELTPDEGDDREAWADAPRGARTTTKAETIFDARRAKLDAAIDMLTNKVEQIVTGEGYRAWLKMVARFHSYSANNVALILAQYPDATKVMGYGNKAGTTGWKSLGRQVREGEKGITIIRPMHRVIRHEDDETAEPVKVLTGFTTATVFDVSQTEGKPLPHEPRPADLTQDEVLRSLELKVKLLRFLDGRGVRVVRDHAGTQRGSWNPEKREIGIRADLSGVQELKTLTHEAVHTLADHRRDGVDRADAETVAESVAFVVLDHEGIDTSAYSVPYIAGWARNPAVVQRNLDAVRTLSHVLLTAFGDPCPPAEDGEEGAGR